MSLILSVSLAYSAGPQKPISPQSVTNPTIQPYQQQKTQVSPAVKTSDAKIIITNPEASELIVIGATYNIKWTKLGQMSLLVDIDLIQNNIKYGIVGSTPNDGVYEWVPLNNLTPGQYQLRITATTSNKTIQFDSAIFQLVNPSIKITPKSIDEIKAKDNAKQKLRDTIKDLNKWIEEEMPKEDKSSDIDNEQINTNAPVRSK
jgi:hypothetical protein